MAMEHFLFRRIPNGFMATSGSYVLIGTMALLVGCRDVISPPLTPDQQAAVKVLDRLANQEATNQAVTLERIRHLPKVTPWERREFVHPQTRETLRYLLFRPATAGQGTNLPLVLSLHGGGPRRQFEHLLEPYLPGLAYGLGRLVSAEAQQKYPSFIVAPWSNDRGWDDANLDLVIAMLDSLQLECPIDARRIYVTGQSMGGWGTWSMITRYPTRFAAAIPICGGGNPADAPRARAIPIWAFHGTADQAVPVRWTRDMIAAVQRAGGVPRYWEYFNEDHSGTAERAYCEPELLDWLFAQRKP